MKMWCGSGVSKITYEKVVDECEDQKRLIKDLEAKVKDLEYHLDRVKSNIYFDKFKYNENDLVPDRRCYIPNGVNLRRIVVINGSWEVVMEEEGRFQTPDVFKEYKKTLGTDRVSKKELFKYMRDKLYIMEQGGSYDDTQGFKI
jgi:hypothetical protein